jgi:hypothetical protein
MRYSTGYTCDMKVYLQKGTQHNAQDLKLHVLQWNLDFTLFKGLLKISAELETWERHNVKKILFSLYHDFERSFKKYKFKHLTMYM